MRSVGAPRLQLAAGAALFCLLAGGMLRLTFGSMAQTLVQMQAPAEIRGQVIGVFISAQLGLQVGSGVVAVRADDGHGELAHSAREPVSAGVQQPHPFRDGNEGGADEEEVQRTGDQQQCAAQSRDGR